MKYAKLPICRTKPNVPSALPIIFLILLILTACGSDKPGYTLGIGKYPGKPDENFAQDLEANFTVYRNIALRRPAWHSSSYDYNLTAQLINDGIIDTLMPLTYRVETSEGMVPKNERGYLFDRQPSTGVSLVGTEGWMKVVVSDKNRLEPADSLVISGSILIKKDGKKGWKFTVSGSDDGEKWSVIKTFSGRDYPGMPLPEGWRRWRPANMRIIYEQVKLDKPVHFSQYRLELSCPASEGWYITDLGLLHGRERLKIGGPYSFTSAWMSEGNGEEWVYIDLGQDCRFDSLALHWIKPAMKAEVAISDDAENWKTIHTISKNMGSVSPVKLENEATARYVCLKMKEPLDSVSYILSEMEVFGSGAPVGVPKPSPLVDDDNILELAGGKWRVQRASEVRDKAEVLSKAGYDVSDWVMATVPGTVLMSYYNAGALPDPDYAANQLMISESFFYSDFWYWNEFWVPESYEGKQVYLNFDGINWKADIFLNGVLIGNIEGAFMRAKFNVTDHIYHNKRNVVAVRIYKNDAPGYVKEQTKYHPASNGGELGGDNPTFHASVGWDWIPTIRGRNIGIWNDVYLSTSGPLTLENPWIAYDLPLPDTTSADIKLEVDVVNHSDEKVTATLLGKIGPVKFEYPIEIDAASTMAVQLDPDILPDLKWQNPKLWWPNGYGKPKLYDVSLTLKTANRKISDSKTFRTGVKEMTYTLDEKENILYIYVNGRRFSGRGGNWGFSESNLRYRAREYEIAVKYHQDMHFTMIRNWVGQTGDREFYEACDRHGIMIWQDFWLANPVDGPDPYDNDMFLTVAHDYIKKIRNHPSIALYCGRNEGYPPEVLDTALRQLVGELHPEIEYISHSSLPPVSGFGPYRAMPVNYYFKERAVPRLHSEIGMPNITNLESVKQMIPDSALWPQDQMWGIHDFCLQGAQGGESFRQLLNDAFGEVDNVEDWVELAQWINFRGYRAIFEAQSRYRMGLQLWMSHPAWPSQVWQTYDYYFDPTAAYFGSKKGSEPLHIQWNAYTDSIEIMNTSYRNGSGLTARIEVFNLDGSLKYEKEFMTDSPEDSRVLLAKHPAPEGLSEVYFLRLKLLKKDRVLSENLYWRALDGKDFSAVREVPNVKLKMSGKRTLQHDIWTFVIRLQNKSDHPALMTRLKVVGNDSGKRILPAIFSDNYITILPGETKEVTVSIRNEDTGGEHPDIVLDGLNL